MPALDLALGHGVIRLAAGVTHALLFEPLGQVGRNVVGPVVGEQARTLVEASLVIMISSKKTNTALQTRSRTKPCPELSVRLLTDA